MKPNSVTPSLDVSWYHSGMQLDSTIPGISITEEEASGGAEISNTLTVTSARTINSGEYLCVASISIPESNTVTSNQSAIVNIRGKYIIM